MKLEVQRKLANMKTASVRNIALGPAAKAILAQEFAAAVENDHADPAVREAVRHYKTNYLSSKLDMAASGLKIHPWYDAMTFKPGYKAAKKAVTDALKACKPPAPKPAKGKGKAKA